MTFLAQEGGVADMGPMNFHALILAFRNLGQLLFPDEFKSPTPVLVRCPDANGGYSSHGLTLMLMEDTSFIHVLRQFISPLNDILRCYSGECERKTQQRNIKDHFTLVGFIDDRLHKHRLFDWHAMHELRLHAPILKGIFDRYAVYDGNGNHVLEEVEFQRMCRNFNLCPAIFSQKEVARIYQSVAAVPEHWTGLFRPVLHTAASAPRAHSAGTATSSLTWSGMQECLLRLSLQIPSSTLKHFESILNKKRLLYLASCYGSANGAHGQQQQQQDRISPQALPKLLLSAGEGSATGSKLRVLLHVMDPMSGDSDSGSAETMFKLFPKSSNPVATSTLSTVGSNRGAGHQGSPEGFVVPHSKAHSVSPADALLEPKMPTRRPSLHDFLGTGFPSRERIGREVLPSAPDTTASLETNNTSLNTTKTVPKSSYTSSVTKPPRPPSSMEDVSWADASLQIEKVTAAAESAMKSSFEIDMKKGVSVSQNFLSKLAPSTAASRNGAEQEESGSEAMGTAKAASASEAQGPRNDVLAPEPQQESKESMEELVFHLLMDPVTISVFATSSGALERLFLNYVDETRMTVPKFEQMVLDLKLVPYLQQTHNDWGVSAPGDSVCRSKLVNCWPSHDDSINFHGFEESIVRLACCVYSAMKAGTLPNGQNKVSMLVKHIGTVLEKVSHGTWE
jgi:hypothetical protein